MTRDIYPIFVYLPDLFTGSRKDLLAGWKMLAEGVRERGLDVGMVVDYFVQDPYHGCPPHIDPTTGEKWKDKKRQEEGLGYYPFGWVKGWVEAENALVELIDTIKPDYIQQGINASELNWKYTLPTDKLYYGYNDTMGMFRQAADRTDWKGTYVVSAWYNHTLKKARDRFGSALTDSDFIDRCTLELPPPPDDEETPPPPSDVSLEDRVQLLEIVVAKVVSLLATIKEELRTWEVPS